jgi:hypothetical protein
LAGFSYGCHRSKWGSGLNFLYGYTETSSEVTITTKSTKDTKEKSKIICFPFVIFVFFVVKTISGIFNWGFADKRDFKLSHMVLGYE